MSPSDIRLHQEPTLKQRKRQAPKGRGLDPHALQEVQGLLGNASRSSDELIEHLHRLQDAFGQLNSKHLAALAHEMRISQAQVYEVASFYHHFDIVKEGQTSPATLTVRVCCILLHLGSRLIPWFSERKCQGPLVEFIVEGVSS